MSILDLSIPNLKNKGKLMANCTFFGHRDAPSTIEPFIKQTILKLLDKGIERFFVGNNGGFDLLVQSALEEISREHSIKYNIVLSYIDEVAISGNQEATILPEGQELVCPRLAICKRNEWMIENSSFVVAYVTNRSTNSYRLVEKSRKIGLMIINLVKE